MRNPCNSASFYYKAKRNSHRRADSQGIPLKSSVERPVMPIMLAFSETEANYDRFQEKNQQIRMKINNFLTETEAKSPIQLNYEQNPKEIHENDKNDKNSHKEIEKLEKSGILNWDASQTRYLR